LLTNADWNALWLSFKLATLSTIILVIIAIPLAWWLTTTRGKIKVIINAIVALPLILPPSVLGFYLLLALGPQGWVGELCTRLGIGLLPFTFSGLVVASVLYSLPFVVQPIQNTFNQIGRRPYEIATCFGAKHCDALFRIFIPEAKSGIICGAVLGFAHTVGEFGMVLMIGGNIPNSTQVISLQIYNHVEAFEYHQAGVLSAILLGFSFIVLLIVYLYNQRFNYLNN
jgi:molybdate transport system permease protein